MRSFLGWILGTSFVLILALGIFYGTRLLKKSAAFRSDNEQTFAMIKPDAVATLLTGKIIDRIEQEKFTIVALKKTTISQSLAKQFYAEHEGKKFFQELVDYITSGPVVLMILNKRNAVSAWRELMGSTDPEKAAPNTLRRLYGTNIGKNAVHGSDSTASAQREIKLMFGNGD